MATTEKLLSVRLKAVSLSMARGQMQHDLRKGYVPKYVDRSRADKNAILFASDVGVQSAAKSVERFFTDQGKVLRKDAGRLLEGILTFSAGAREQVNAAPPDAQASRFFSEFCEQHHAQPVYLVRHGDETTVHYHFMLENLNRANGRTISRDLHKVESSALQDHAGSVFSEIGIARGVKKLTRIQRGEPTSATIHRTVRELHSDLPNEIAVLEAKRAKNQAYIDASQSALAAAQDDEEKTAKIRKRIATYEARVAQIDQDIAQAMPSVRKPMIVSRDVVVSKSVLKTVTETVEVATKTEVDRFADESMNVIRYLKSCLADADERVDQREREAERLRKIVSDHRLEDWNHVARDAKPGYGHIVHVNDGQIYVRLGSTEIVRTAATTGLQPEFGMPVMIGHGAIRYAPDYESPLNATKLRAWLARQGLQPVTMTEFNHGVIRQRAVTLQDDQLLGRQTKAESVEMSE